MIRTHDLIISFCVLDPSPRPKRRSRHNFSKHELKVLEEVFANGTEYPTLAKRFLLSKQLSLSEEMVRVWFQNRRSTSARKKRERLTVTDQRVYEENGTD